MKVVQLINGLGYGGGEQMLVPMARELGRDLSVWTLTRQGPLADVLRDRRLGYPEPARCGGEASLLDDSVECPHP